MKKILGILALSLFLLSCNGRKNANEKYSSDIEEVVTDSMPLDSLHHPSPDEFEDGHMPPPPPDVLPMSLTICVASTPRQRMTWTTTA